MKHISEIEPSKNLKTALQGKVSQCTCRVYNYDPRCPFMTDIEWAKVEEWLEVQRKEKEDYERAQNESYYAKPY